MLVRASTAKEPGEDIYSKEYNKKDKKYNHCGWYLDRGNKTFKSKTVIGALVACKGRRKIAIPSF